MPINLRRRATSSTTSSKVSSDSPTPSASPSSPNSREKVDKSGLYDLAQIKRLLDDQVISVSIFSLPHILSRYRSSKIYVCICIYIYQTNAPNTKNTSKLHIATPLQFMEDRGYEEAILVSNVKIVAGTGATAAAVYSHFNPYEYPANRNLVLFCVIFYAVCIAAINVTSYLWENSAIFVGKVGAKPHRVSKGVLTPKVWAFSKIAEKGSSDYKIDLKVAPRCKVGTICASHPYELYFTEEGTFLKDVFRQHMTEAMDQLDAANSKKSS